MKFDMGKIISECRREINFTKQLSGELKHEFMNNLTRTRKIMKIKPPRSSPPGQIEGEIHEMVVEDVDLDSKRLTSAT